MEVKARIYIAGQRGMVMSAISRRTSRNAPSVAGAGTFSALSRSG
jgi:hypothetical protein